MILRKEELTDEEFVAAFTGKKRKPSVFVKYVLSYLLILLIPIAFGAAHYERTQQVLTDDATELNLQILQMSQDIVDRLFLESDDVVSALAVDNDVIRLLQSPQKPPTPEQLYNYSLLRNSLNRYVITNKLFQDIFIWFQESGSVVTSRTAYDLNNNNVSVEGKPLAEWLQEVSSTDGKKQVFNLNDVKLEGRDYSLIAYVSPLPNGVQGKARGPSSFLSIRRTLPAFFSALLRKGDTLTLPIGRDS
ncbi:hypothetical protein N6H14_28130 [Paenibacillus sp. CC-CFT747]|nr:hypothetical protein N6H14_28130 [Paenibacillus sp. CC-CFT747]